MHKIDKRARTRPTKLHIKKSIFYNVRILGWGYHPRDVGEPSSGILIHKMQRGFESIPML